MKGACLCLIRDVVYKTMIGYFKGHILLSNQETRTPLVGILSGNEVLLQKVLFCVVVKSLILLPMSSS